MSDTASVTIGDLVRVVFKGWPEGHPKTGYPLELRWNNRPFIIPAGQEKHVPFECAKVYFGDPRSVEGVIRIKDDMGNDMIVADRVAEVIRLQGFWQNSGMATNRAKFKEYIPGDRSYLAEGVSDLLPNVEIYSMTGQRIFMVVDDPYGDHVVATQQTRHQTEIMRQQLVEQSDAISELKRQNRMLLDKLGLDPDMLNPITPTAQDSALETPTDATVEEKPKMLYNPRTRRVSNRRPLPGSDPTSIQDLPQDID